MKKVVYILSCISLFLSCSDKDVYKAPETDLNLLKPYEDMEGRSGGVCLDCQVI